MQLTGWSVALSTEHKATSFCQNRTLSVSYRTHILHTMWQKHSLLGCGRSGSIGLVNKIARLAWAAQKNAAKIDSHNMQLKICRCQLVLARLLRYSCNCCSPKVLTCQPVQVTMESSQWSQRNTDNTASTTTHPQGFLHSLGSMASPSIFSLMTKHSS